jgi:hypothetical protein
VDWFWVVPLKPGVGCGRAVPLGQHQTFSLAASRFVRRGFCRGGRGGIGGNPGGLEVVGVLADLAGAWFAASFSWWVGAASQFGFGWSVRLCAGSRLMLEPGFDLYSSS